MKFLSRLAECLVHATPEANERASRLHQHRITAAYHPRIKGTEILILPIKGTVILIAAIKISVPLIA